VERDSVPALVDPISRQLVTRLRQDPRDEAAYEALKAHYFELGDFASLANLLEGWASQFEAIAPEAAAEAFLDAARAVLQSSGPEDRARSLYENALRVDVLKTDAAQELLALIERSGDPQALFEMLDRYSQGLESKGADPLLIASVYARIGQLCEEGFQQTETAAQYYERARELEVAAKTGPVAVPAAVPAAQLRAVPAEPAPAEPPPTSSTASASDLAAAEEQIGAYEHELQGAADSERRIDLYSAIARLHVDARGSIKDAILVLRRALSEVPGDVQIMHQLAACLLARAATAEPEAAQGDYFRVAELFYQIAQGVDEQQALTYLESALDAMPGHEGALALLERIAEQRGESERLPARWVAFVAQVGETPEADARRIALGEAYIRAGQPRDAADCLKPLADRGHSRAHELLQHVYAQEAAPIDASTGRASHPERQPGRASQPEPLPAVRPRAGAIEERASVAGRVAELRRKLHEQIASRKHDESAQTCQQILEIDPNDPEAFNLLESHFRKRRDYKSLRDLLLASTRSPGLSVDARKARLREVATLSESKLKDAEGAVSAFRGVVTLDPSDRDAVRNLKRLLKKAESWDELASVIEREALSATDPQEKAALIHEIALIHRDKRKDPAETAEALRQLHALRPEDAAIRDELLELCLSLGQLEDAARLLRERIDTASEDRDKIKSLTQLAGLLHEQLSDPEEAFRTSEAVLAIKASDRAAFERMERIDEELGNHERLLRTIERRAAQVARTDKPALLMRMGVLADEKVGDADKAAEYFGEALDLAPDNTDALDRLVQVFEKGGRYADLAELLRERAIIEKSSAARAALFRKLGSILSMHVGDVDGAIESYEKLLAIEQDMEALEYLSARARERGEHEKLVTLLKRSSELASTPDERRDLAHEQALILRDDLDRKGEALRIWRSIVAELDPAHRPAIDALEALASEQGDQDALALALERKLALTIDPAERAAQAKRLAELCEPLADQRPRLIGALLAWAQAAERDPEPRRRLRPLLRAEQRYAELVEVLDALATWEDALDARDAALIEAASVAFEQLGDADSAWRRLLPLTEEQNEEAEALLASIARKAGRAQQLSALYVRLAQSADGEPAQAEYWEKAATVFEQDLDKPDQAFEAALRMLAVDLNNRARLELVDRLAAKIRAWKRLAQVYDRLLRATESDADKAPLLSRHASVLELDEPDEALDRLLRACSLTPDDQALLERTEALAQTRKRSEDLLVVYDRKRARAKDDGERIEALLRAVSLCDSGLRDRERALSYLKQALAAASTPELRERVRLAARTLDAQRPELGAESARRALVRQHRELSDKAPQAVASDYMRRAAALLMDELKDERGALDFLRQGVALVPLDDALYDALHELASRLGRLDAVEPHLARLIDEAIDSNVTVALLRRRAALLETLDRVKDATLVLAKLLQLRPDDADAARKLRAGLRAAGRFQDLLVALDKQLQRTKEPELRLGILKEIARIWESDLRNRWEATDAWKAVRRQDPDDAEAVAALERLAKSKTSPGSVASVAAAVSERSEYAEVLDRAEPPAERADVQPASTSEEVKAEIRAEEPANEASPDRDTAPDEATVNASTAADAEPDTVTEVGAPPASDEPLATREASNRAATQDVDLSELKAMLPSFEEEADDLDALDAMVGPTVEELDAFNDSDAINVEEEVAVVVDATPAPRRSAPPPPPPLRTSVGAPSPRASVPPPLPSSRTTGSGQTRASVPPPLPKRER
jgi:tetratricopeptide (TPR) repeat protein